MIDLDILTNADVKKLNKFCVDIESTKVILEKIKKEKNRIRGLPMDEKSKKEVIDAYTELSNLEQRLSKKLMRNKQ